MTQATSNTRRIFALPGTAAYSLNSSGGAAIGFVRAANNDDSIVFETHEQGASHAARMSIGPSGTISLFGSVSLSSNAPTRKGKIRISGASDASTDGGIEFHTSSGGGGGYGTRITADASGDMHFLTRSNNAGWAERLRITGADGHLLPGSSTQDLGSSSARWANIYSADLQLSNEGKSNDVDGTWGNFTIQEGESELFLINNRNGKKYKFNLTEVS